MAYLGKSTCPWCNTQDAYGSLERLLDKLPHKWQIQFAKATTPYDLWVGRVGGGWHRRAH